MTTALWCLAALIYGTFVVLYIRQKVEKLCLPANTMIENKIVTLQHEPKTHHFAHASR